MKGVIVLSLKEMVQNRFGEGKWKEALKQAGIEKEPIVLPQTDVEDGIELNVVKSLCNVLSLPLQELADAFGDYWVNVYSQRIYSNYYKRAKTAREFLMMMDSVHTDLTKSMPNAHPPKFKYETPDEKRLIMTYISDRGLIDFMVGLIKGVGRFYKEDLKVKKIGNDKVEIVFP